MQRESSVDYIGWLNALVIDSILFSTNDPFDTGIPYLTVSLRHSGLQIVINSLLDLSPLSLHCTQLVSRMLSAASIVKLARANLNNAARRVCAIAEPPMYESIYAFEPRTHTTRRQPVSRHIASARARRMIAEPPMYQSSCAFKPQGAIAFSTRVSSSMAAPRERGSTSPCLPLIPGHQALDLALD